MVKMAKFWVFDRHNEIMTRWHEMVSLFGCIARSSHAKSLSWANIGRKSSACDCLMHVDYVNLLLFKTDILLFYLVDLDIASTIDRLKTDS